MQLTEEQSAALEQLLSSSAPLQVVSGPAGVGKSTLLAAIHKRHPNVAYLAPTNKAALVLRQKGIAAASTLHSVLYSPLESVSHRKTASGDIVHQTDAEGNKLLDIDNQPIPEINSIDLNFQLREDNGNAHELTAYMDEASMLQEQQLKDLQEFFGAVVLTGDKFQLPPVKSRDIFTLHPPTIELREIHRTALESPILRYATALRRELVEPVTDDHSLRTCGFNNKRLFESIVEHDCQAITFSNKLRHIINERIRNARGLAPSTLLKGEQIVSLDNVRLTIDGQQFLKFYNGEILELAEDAEDDPTATDFYRLRHLKFTNGKTHRCWPFWLRGFWDEKEQSGGTKWANRIYAMRARGELYGAPLLADYAACLTAHKAQGSEWPNVAVFDQRSLLLNRTGELMTRRWLYTAVTRAKQRCLMVNC